MTVARYVAAFVLIGFSAGFTIYASANLKVRKADAEEFFRMQQTEHAVGPLGMADEEVLLFAYRDSGGHWLPRKIKKSAYRNVPETGAEEYFRMLLYDRAAGHVNLVDPEWVYFGIPTSEGSLLPRKVKKALLTQEAATRLAVEFVDRLVAKPEISIDDALDLIRLVGSLGPPESDLLEAGEWVRKLWKTGMRERFLWVERDRETWIANNSPNPPEDAAFIRAELRRDVQSIRNKTILEVVFFSVFITLALAIVPLAYRSLTATRLGRTLWFSPVCIAVAIVLCAGLIVVPRQFFAYAPDAATEAAGPHPAGTTAKYCTVQPFAYLPGNTIVYRQFVELLARPMLAIADRANRKVPRDRLSLYFVVFYSILGYLVAMTLLVVALLRRRAVPQAGRFES